MKKDLAATRGEIMALIEAERERQISVEGWTAEHDDQHAHGEMLHAAMIYRSHARGEIGQHRDDGAPLGWPWDASWWKPKGPLQDLVRAGALCLAEADRLRRTYPGRATMDRDPASPANHKLALIIGDLNILLPPKAANPVTRDDKGEFNEH